MADTSTALTRWLQGRADQWRRLDTGLARQHDVREDDPQSVRELVRGFRALGRDLAMARATLPGSRLAQQLEVLFTRAHELIYRRAHNTRRELVELYRDDIPALVTGLLRGPIRATVALFLACMGAGWGLVSAYPELAGLFASEDMINQVQRGKLWTDDLLNVLPSSVLSLSIMSNNIAVSLFAFAMGAFYGLGTLYIISLNGLMLGGIFAFTAHYGLAERLFAFVVAHGVVELSIICLAGAAGMQLGEALIRPGPRTRVAAFQAAVADAGKLLFVAVPFLVGAGLIEGFISPDDSYPLASRVTIGLGYGVLMWVVLTGRWRRQREG